METLILEPTEENLALAGEMLREGKLVAFPTETVYGLGANALDPEAVKKVYEAKGRPSDNPMIVHISRASDIGQLTPMLSEGIVSLIDHFWPGPLTLVVKKKPGVPSVTAGGLETIGVRIPDEKIALDIINYAGVPIAAPSANLSGKPSPTKAEHVIEDLYGKVDAIIKGPDCRVGIESTVLDLSGEKPMILRPGIVTKEDLELILKKPVEIDPSLLTAREGAEGQGEFSPKAPGMKYKHYAPKAEMIVIEGHRDKVRSEIARLKMLNERLGRKVGVIFFEEKAFREAAHNFFADLRDLDAQGVDLILAGALSEVESLGFAVMNRMLKAAGYHIVTV